MVNELKCQTQYQIRKKISGMLNIITNIKKKLIINQPIFTANNKESLFPFIVILFFINSM
ncbi:hypothetical protein LINPERPRIM_LOCUS31345 [Linum perenne]